MEICLWIIQEVFSFNIEISFHYPSLYFNPEFVHDLRSFFFFQVIKYHKSREKNSKRDDTIE